MFSSDPILKNRLLIKRAKLLIVAPALNACQLEFNWTTLSRLGLVEGVLAQSRETERGIERI